jgi:hypothetical protein
MRRITFVIALLALVAGAVSVRAGDMTLTKSGSLYRLASDGEQLVLTLTAADGSVTSLPVPQTTGIDARNLEVAVEESTGTVVTLWQEGEVPAAQIALATLNAGAWQGPTLVAGYNGASAANPALLVRRVTTVVEEESGPVVYSTTTAHVAWWQGLESADGGLTVYAAIPIEDNGSFDLSLVVPRVLRDLIPFGLPGCSIEDPALIAHPRLFVDPQTGDPHILAVDLAGCLFQIVQLKPRLDEPDPVTKRRRHTIIFGYAEMIATNPALPLQTAKVEVGHNLSVVLYWDTANAVSYANLDAEGWSAVKVLPLNTGLSHEQAIELIRGLAK